MPISHKYIKNATFLENRCSAHEGRTIEMELLPKYILHMKCRDLPAERGGRNIQGLCCKITKVQRQLPGGVFHGRDNDQ